MGISKVYTNVIEDIFLLLILRALYRLECFLTDLFAIHHALSITCLWFLSSKICFHVISLEDVKWFFLANYFHFCRNLCCAVMVYFQIHLEARKFSYQTGLKALVAYGGTPINQQVCAFLLLFCQWSFITRVIHICFKEYLC
jgi:hypothetical protein